MKKKTLNSLQDLTLAYSTHSLAEVTKESESDENDNKVLQKVRVERYTKLKGGKSLSRIFGIDENDKQLNELCKYIKQKCGLGGAVKDGEILIQGDQVDKIIKILIEKGYKNTKRSGG
ncbi:MAG: translation initiation factor [Saprospiraceae bacterium]|nr:translation initiation factor [Saprospiraceae bacterium]MBK8449843.1 translation initiation factor [Saprospiraceae bacterium]MBK9221504.1 translation initiation factor [Saprospiraceae bacterium]